LSPVESHFVLLMRSERSEYPSGVAHPSNKRKMVSEGVKNANSQASRITRTSSHSTVSDERMHNSGASVCMYSTDFFRIRFGELWHAPQNRAKDSS